MIMKCVFGTSPFTSELIPDNRISCIEQRRCCAGARVPLLKIRIRILLKNPVVDACVTFCCDAKSAEMLQNCCAVYKTTFENSCTIFDRVPFESAAQGRGSTSPGGGCAPAPEASRSASSATPSGAAALRRVAE